MSSGIGVLTKKCWKSRNFGQLRRYSRSWWVAFGKFRSSQASSSLAHAGVSALSPRSQWGSSIVAPHGYMGESVRMHRCTCCREVVTASAKLDGWPGGGV